MYTWGYIKEATLVKMDMSSSEANEMGLLNKIPFYANEALSQITSGIRAKRSYVAKAVMDRGEMVMYLRKKYNLVRTDFLGQSSITDAMLSETSLAARKEYNQFEYVAEPITMPDDFVAWNDDPVYRERARLTPQIKFVSIPGMDVIHENVTEVNTGVYVNYGNNQIIFNVSGIYHIPYNAKWFTFTSTTDDSVKLDIPDDIVDCLPSYIAAELFKIDDEQKSSIYRNEFEMYLARLDDNYYGSNKTIRDGHNW